MDKSKLLVVAIAGLLGAAAGLAIAFKTAKSHQQQKPPKAAPQLNINNPGDQSGFPVAPQGERDLG
jgi:hypothetical protein